MNFLTVYIIGVSLLGCLGVFASKTETLLDAYGFKWCGKTVTGKHFDDLGPPEDVDKCCRSHYFNTDYVEARAFGHNLYNYEDTKRYSCMSEGLFLKCLKDVNSTEANAVGHAYFNKKPTKCFMVNYPIKRCLKYSVNPTKKCILYEVNKLKKQKNQWFDVPAY